MRGFTLIELLLVFSIAGLLASVVPLAFDTLREGAAYRDTVRAMATGMRAARHRAALEGRDLGFVVDLDRRAFRIGDDTAWRSVPDALRVRALGTDGEPQATGRAVIRFLPGGGATGGGVEILRGSGAGSRLRVDWLSGHVIHEGLSP